MKEENGLTVKFDRAKRERLRKATNEAKRSRLEEFKFEGHDYLVRYAEYLLEYLDDKLKGVNR